MLDLELLGAAGRLKTVKRQGWLDARIPPSKAESVADHCFRTALIVAFSARRDVDALKAVKMALVHDIAEFQVGDITPRSGIARERKVEMEEAAVSGLGDPEVLGLWKEYEEGSTPEARLVREADVLERLAQAKEYERAGHPGKELEPFWEGWSREILSPAMRVLVRKLAGAPDDTVKYH